MRRALAILTTVLTLTAIAVEPASAGPALNWCDWNGPWASTASMAFKRDGATSTVLANGKVLIVGGFDNVNTVAIAEIFDPASDTFTMVGSLVTDRTGHTATLLGDGRVLITGGIRILNGAFVARLGSAEIFDPVSNSFSPVASMSTSRQNAAAVLLGNGRVLVSGGFGGTGSIHNWQTSAEVFDPATGGFSAVGPMVTGRGLHTLTRMFNNKVLVAGGYNGFAALNTAEIYDSVTHAFTAAGSMSQARMYHTATLMPFGNVLITGGTNLSSTHSSIESFVPSGNSGSFSSGGSLTVPRQNHSATMLLNGKLLVTGGQNSAGTALASAEITAVSGSGFTFTALPAMPAARAGHVSEVLSNGTILIAGGRAAANSALQSALLYDPFFTSTASMAVQRTEHTATRLASGLVLVTGGLMSSAPTEIAQLYNPATGSWSTTGSMALPRYKHTATTLADGRVLIIGGFTTFSASATATAEVFNPMTGTFSAAGSMATARQQHTATLLPNGRVLVTGGAIAGTPLSSAEVWDPATNAFVTINSMNRDRRSHTATLLVTGQVLIAGGWSNAVSGITYSIEVFDPATGVFTMPPNANFLWTNRMGHRATPLPDGTVLVTGGMTSGLTPTNIAEIYNPWYNSFSPTNTNMRAARMGHAVTETALSGGRLVLLGGQNQFSQGFLSSVEIYDPATKAFSDAPGSMQVDRSGLTATLLFDSRILVTGGSGSAASTAELSKPTQCGPMITSLSPTGGPAGTSVTISGSQFGFNQGASTVTFNGVSAGVNSWSNTQIVAIVPPGATTGPVIVTVNGRASNGPTFTVGSPDLIVQSIVANPAAPLPGQVVNISLTIRNQGQIQSRGVRADFYRHRTTAPGAIAGDFFCSFKGLIAGGTATCNGNVTYNAGTYQMWAQVDTFNTNSESNESNNILGPQTIVVQAPRPDLVESAVSNPPSSIVVGASFSASDTVVNNGPGAAGVSMTRFYLSTDQVKDASDRLLNGTRTVGGLSAGAASSGSVSVTVPASTPAGLYHLLACADDQAWVLESNEVNNCIASGSRVAVEGANLMEDFVSDPPAAALVGDSFTAFDATINMGSVTAAASTVRYYLSLDSVKDAADVLLVGSRAVASVAPGTGTKGSAAVTISGNTPDGIYYLLACADDLSVVNETNEADNCIASRGQISVTGPDLIADGVDDPPQTAPVGSTFMVKDSIVNIGSESAGASTTMYYLSTDEIWDAADVLLNGSRNVPALAPRSGDSDSVKVEIPLGTTPDKYFLIVCADDPSAVAESNEANNCLASRSFMTVTP
jgi:subtilase family serine protease